MASAFDGDTATNSMQNVLTSDCLPLCEKSLQSRQIPQTINYNIKDVTSMSLLALAWLLAWLVAIYDIIPPDIKRFLALFV